MILASLERPDHSAAGVRVGGERRGSHRSKRWAYLVLIYASLSPDGEFVVYDSPQAGSIGARDIFIVRSDGSEDRRLVEHPANDRALSGRRTGAASFRERSSEHDGRVGCAGRRRRGAGRAHVVHRNIGRMRLCG